MVYESFWGSCEYVCECCVYYGDFVAGWDVGEFFLIFILYRLFNFGRIVALQIIGRLELLVSNRDNPITRFTRFNSTLHPRRLPILPTKRRSLDNHNHLRHSPLLRHLHRS